jgi:4-hydroxybenzoyl-CoA reductase subunit beta
MQRLPAFVLHRPTSALAAASLLAAEPGARLLAGGTDLMPNLRRGIEQPPTLIALDGARDIGEIAFDSSGVSIGAGVSLAQLAGDARIARDWPVIAEAAASVAGPGHRNAASLGGNLCQDTRCVYYNQSAWWRAANDHCLKRGGDTCHVAPQGQRCHAAYAGDMAPALLVLGAQVELLSRGGVRRIPLAALYHDDGAAHLLLAQGEVLTRVHLPAVAQPGLRCGYRKARTRAAMDFPLAGVACAVTLRAGAIVELRVAITGTNTCPFLLAGCDVFAGRRVDAEVLTQLGKNVQKQVSPMRSTVTPSNYRRLAAAALAQRLLRDLAATGD